MFWKQVASCAYQETSAVKLSAIVPSVVTTLSVYLLQWKFDVRSLQLTLICIGIGLATYALIIAGQFTLKFFQVIGRDQDSKQTAIENSIRQLAKLLHPELSEKSERAIQVLEARIREADSLFNTSPVTEEGLRAWTGQTAYLLARTTGQGSDWFEQFEKGVCEHPGRIEVDRNQSHVLLLRRVAVLRDVIDEIKHQRVLVLDPRITIGRQP
ncbi:MAG: hypothetical protein IVW54_06145 [Candidatus Binataceae bacterium]|nr:hypothetical protein [Candidatus Binataceae bacterium]